MVTIVLPKRVNFKLNVLYFMLSPFIQKTSLHVFIFYVFWPEKRVKQRGISRSPILAWQLDLLLNFLFLFAMGRMNGGNVPLPLFKQLKKIIGMTFFWGVINLSFFWICQIFWWYSWLGNLFNRFICFKIEYFGETLKAWLISSLRKRVLWTLQNPYLFKLFSLALHSRAKYRIFTFKGRFETHLPCQINFLSVS